MHSGRQNHPRYFSDLAVIPGWLIGLDLRSTRLPGPVPWIDPPDRRRAQPAYSAVCFRVGGLWRPLVFFSTSARSMSPVSARVVGKPIGRLNHRMPWPPPALIPRPKGPPGRYQYRHVFRIFRRHGPAPTHYSGSDIRSRF